MNNSNGLKAGRDRRGLATLELVLALPMLLFVMALIIVFGTVAAWKVRGLATARHAVWSTRTPRNGGALPRPAYWPDNAGVNSAGGGEMPELDDPRVNLPVARGPLPYGCVVNDDLLDPSRGLRVGSSELHRYPPMMRGLGEYQLPSHHRLLDDRRQFGEMGLASNQSQRVPAIYELPRADVSLANAYVTAAMAILNASFRPALRPLDNDDEFIYWQLGAPDFHPRLHRFCSLDHAEAADRVEDLVRRIQGSDDPDVPSLAENMARAFRGLYQYAIRRLQRAGGSRAQIAALQRKIAILDQFLRTL